MSSSQFPQESGQSNLEIVTLIDEAGRSLDCYIENSLESEDSSYLLLLPISSPVVIIACDEEDEDEEAVIVEDSSDLEQVFDDAKAVLAELDLILENTAFTLTVRGELPPIDYEEVLTLELEQEDGQIEEEEELQFLASFYHLEQKYSIYTPIAPLLFVAQNKGKGQLELLSPEDPQLEPILEDLLLNELE
ncbi:MAG: DUF3727 domain-containing protein [Moorea sp. SIO2B7]|nr:DUF3727 domain-containing protein [Moorena sp. SIO2B7]